MYAKHCLTLCVLLAVVNGVLSQQEEQVRHRICPLVVLRHTVALAY